MRLICILILVCMAVGCSVTSSRKKFSYPHTKTIDHTDSYFGNLVADPYRWLEHDTAADVGEWVEAQNTLTFDYLSQIPYKDQIRERLENLYNYEKYSAPSKEGDVYFFFKNDGLQNQSVLYIQKDLDAEPEVFLDPNTFSEDGTIALAGASFSKDGKYFAYSTTESGSDWRTIYVMDIASRSHLSDTIRWAKFTGISWRKGGFYYSSYDQPGPGEKLSSFNYQHKVYYHKLGTDQSEDQLIFGGESQPVRYANGYVSQDESCLFVSAAERTDGNELYFQNLTKPGSKLMPLTGDQNSNHSAIYAKDSRLFIKTDLNAPNGKIVRVTTDNPTSKNWKDLVPEQPEVLISATTAGSKLFLTYLKDASSRVYQYNLDGKLEREIELPTLGTAYGFAGKEADTEVFYTFTSFTYPPTIYRYDIATGTSTLFRQPQIDYNPADFITEQVFYDSKDGTRVPMFLVYHKNLEKNGQNPTYLYSYGGFNISLVPNFSVTRLLWLEQGGIYAMPNIRGGGEYGKEWHDGGIKDRKQNVFDDFIAAAEYLIAQKYTSSEKLGIFGGSNGGLLVGACMTQRPELFQVAVPAVGVLDMLRYHKFTAGAGWIYDYGCADSSQAMFEYLYGYSPVHNVQEGVAYPATLVKTADHDDRVVPAHSFKFISELQAKHAGDAPVMIRIDTKSGHGGGKPTAKILDEWADTYAFTLFNMGLSYQYDPSVREALPQKYD